jgi:hypothetical protein
MCRSSLRLAQITEILRVCMHRERERTSKQIELVPSAVKTHRVAATGLWRIVGRDLRESHGRNMLPGIRTEFPFGEGHFEQLLRL